MDYGFEYIKLNRKSKPPRNNVTSGDYVDQWGKQTPPNVYRLLHEYSEAFYGLANMNAQAVAKTPIRLYGRLANGYKTVWPTKAIHPYQEKHLTSKIGFRASGRVEEITEHRFLDLLHHPNPHMTWYELLLFTQLYLEVVGVAYWYVQTDLFDRPKHLWLMSPQFVRLNRGADGFPESYSYNGVSYDASVVVRFAMPDLLNMYIDGRSPVRACFESLNIDDKFRASLASTLDNEARPGLLISFPEGGPENMDREEATFNSKLKRAGQGGTMFIDDSVDVTTLPFPGRDLAALTISDNTLAMAARDAGIPMALVETKDVNRANMISAKALHAENATVPRHKMIEGRVNKFICDWFEPSGKLFACFDDPTPEQAELKQAELCGYVSSGVITANEAREDIGYAPIKGGDELVGNFNWAGDMAATQATPDAPAPKPQPTPAADDEEQDKPKTKILSVKEYKAWKAARSRVPDGKALVPILQRFFAKQRKEVMATINKHMADCVTKAIKAELPSEFVPLDKWTDDLAEECRPVIEILFSQGGKQLIQRVGASADVFNVTNPHLRKEVNRLTLEFCEQTNRTTTMALNTALAKLRADLADGLVEGDRMSDLTSAVAKVFDEAEQYRCHRIAQSEASRSHSEGLRAAAKESGVVKGFELLLSSEACPLCVSVKEQTPVVGLDGSFAGAAGNAEYPDSLLPIHPNCLCSVLEVLDISATEVPDDQGD